MKRRLAAAAAAWVLGLAGAAGADFSNVDVTYWAGAGANEAMVVVDFAPGQNYAFGYRWDGNATAWDALVAVDAGGALDANASPFVFGGITYHFVNDLFLPAAVRGSGAAWGCFISSDGNAWTASLIGADGEGLADGGWSGWSWSNFDENYNFTRPPTTPLVPEPGTLAILALAGAGLIVRRRRR